MRRRIPTRSGSPPPPWLAATMRIGGSTWRDSMADRVPGLAAEVAFFALLSLPPLLLVALGALGYVGDLLGGNAVARMETEIIDFADAFLTARAVDEVVQPAVAELLERGRADILSVGAVLALWSGSRAIRVFVRAVAAAYDIEDRRSWWQHWLVGLGVTVAGIITVAVLLPLLVVGPEAGAGLADRLGLERAFEVTWRVLWWPVVLILGMTLLTWLYHIVPPHATAWRRDLPGAVLATAVWLLGSFALRLYAVNFIETDSAYSLFGAPLVVLLWLYLTVIALLVGAELNAEIEKAYPSMDTSPPPPHDPADYEEAGGSTPESGPDEPATAPPEPARPA